MEPGTVVDDLARRSAGIDRPERTLDCVAMLL